jgi:hypothetical protein
MPVNRNLATASHPALEQFLARVAALTSERRVRPVVTPSGKRARGLFPSIKSPGRARYESLLEHDVLRVLEVCRKIRVIRTHPAVLALPGARLMHYTPDVQIERADGGALVETKATFFLSNEVARTRLGEVNRRLREHGVQFLVFIESDVQRPGFQDELKALLRLRPVVGRYRPRIDTSAWHPLLRPSTDADAERRWRAAQLECDALLERVMRRDPDEFINSFSR